ncbi:uncharacterized protein [Spinacia oleracea]|uniref:DUF4218 domain-containing protein n=1 Tax=Spinacia oleracea TaxID=3562 RepID=A0ABM3RP04_SPIOL|nr:uncharacterized protein LOC130471320 [Spinacia oleracea]
MDTSWIDLRKGTAGYYNGCMKFLEVAKETLLEGMTRCPCNKCKLNNSYPLEEVGGHILFYGFYKNYRQWVFHCKDEESNTIEIPSDQAKVVGRDDIDGLLAAAFRVDNTAQPTNESQDPSLSEANFEDEDPYNMHEELNFDPEEDDEFPSTNTNEEEAKYKRLREASDEGLYEGCTTFSKLSFLLHLFHLKCMFHWSAASFNKLLELLLDAFPIIMEFPSSYYEGMKIIKDLGLSYEKIHACPNDCILYWGEFAEKNECHICHTSRWRNVNGNEGDTSENVIKTRKKGVPAKVMRYFPLIPRLKRLYMSSKTAEDMRWHFDRKDEKIISHPADGEAWKKFDQRYEEFAKDPRSVRLGLASDGFNPYRLMNTSYSTWPVILIPYNLPPWLCMKSTSFILSLIIPGKSGPGMDIDVYLQPLIHELKLLWEGVDAFDAHSGKSFKMRAALHSTINDFPAYAMLSGWSTKGYKACPSCADSGCAYSFGGKIVYPVARKWLPADHPYRSQANLFDGKEEHGFAPVPLSGTEILKQQERVKYVYGKSKIVSKKRGRLDNDEIEEDDDGQDDVDKALWKKKSKLFELEYWEYNPLRHNLDVMHIEKNVCDNFLGTLLDMEKSRDDKNSRLALQARNIKSHLWPQSHPNRVKDYLPSAAYTMSKEEKERFLNVLQKLKVPDGYGSNLQKCVNMKQRKLINLKSHDNHVLMQDILPVALRASNATKVIDLLDELSDFFKKICSTSIDRNELDTIQSKLVLTLCKMEKEFLPTFFTIMVHLLIHLVDEVKLGGPVHYRWMYPIERYLAFLKSHVSNKAKPEGSIAEGYLLWETIAFCSRYLESVETIFNRPKRNEDGVPDINNYLYYSGGRVVGMKENVRLDDKSLKQAHRYVLLHSDEMKPANNLDDSTKEGKLRKALAGGLSNRSKRMKSVIINGYKFDTVDRERSRKTQNSGIMVEAEGQEYYGKLKEILELDYYGSFKVLMFRCDWADIRRGFKTYPSGRVRVNFSKLMHTGQNLEDDPFIFSSQAKQVFYIEDEIQKGWFHVIKTKPRDLFDIPDDDDNDDE